jgi:hypothetical protein
MRSLMWLRSAASSNVHEPPILAAPGSSPRSAKACTVRVSTPRIEAARFARILSFSIPALFIGGFLLWHPLGSPENLQTVREGAATLSGYVE